MFAARRRAGELSSEVGGRQPQSGQSKKIFSAMLLRGVDRAIQSIAHGAPATGSLPAESEVQTASGGAGQYHQETTRTKPTVARTGKGTQRARPQTLFLR